MALAPLCSITIQVRPTIKLTADHGKGTADDWLPIVRVFRCIPSSGSCNNGRWASFCDSKLLKPMVRPGCYGYAICNKSLPFQNLTKVPPLKVFNTDSLVKYTSKDVPHVNRPCSEFHASVRGNESQLKALDSYFSKLPHNIKERSPGIFLSDCGSPPDSKEHETASTLNSECNITDVVDRDELKGKMGLSSLENYLDKIKTGISKEESRSPPFLEEYSKSNSIRRSDSTSEEYYGKTEGKVGKSRSNVLLENMDGDTSPVLLGDNNLQDFQLYDETSNFHITNLLASINIAVFLFEIASPIKNSDIDNLSLPLVYGAKINKLILDGEWWRLVTPMFLHSGFLHVALSCWVLLTFGPQVCKGYGPFTFFLIYIMGGVCGNLTSFIHTPELTVCGTAPVFAIIGAWLIYQVQNKEAIAEDVSEGLFWKAVIATVLSFILSTFGQIDDWTHLGAAFSGLVYGFLTCPTVELNNASSKRDQKEGIRLVKQQADPRKSLLTFILFIFILCSVFSFDPELDILELDSLL